MKTSVRLLVVLGVFFLALETQAQQVVIKLGTVAPSGSPWHDMLKAMGERWRGASNGKVQLTIFPGGVAGDEPDMLRKLRVGQLHAVTLTGAWLGSIEPAVRALQIPFAFSSYEELDYVRERLSGRLEALLEKKGLLVFNWGDAGWVTFFTQKPASRIAELRSMKLFSWAGDPQTIGMWRDAGFQPVPLASTDITLSLQTGLINAFNATALAAVSFQWFTLAPYMIDLRWAPLIGATVVAKRAWDKVPVDLRPVLEGISREAGQQARSEIRILEQEAVRAMTKRGLQIVRIPDEFMAEWRQVAEAAYPRLQRELVPPEYFKEVFRLRDEYRAKKAVSLPAHR